MPQYSPQQLASACNGKLIGQSNGLLSELYYDSRKLFSAQGALFIAIRGANHNGHHYISALYNKGVLAFMVETNQHITYSNYPDALFIEVPNCLDGLQQIAAYHRQNINVPVIAITGSNGKTIVKEWLTRLCETSFTTTRSPRSYNSQLGVPLSLWLINAKTELAIIEAGISQPSEMKRLATCIQPTIGIFTNLGSAHQENFASTHQKLNEKLDLFESTQTIITSADNKVVIEAIQKRYPNKTIITFGNDSSNNLHLNSQQIKDGQTTFSLTWLGTPFETTLPFTDKISIENALLALTSSLFLGVNPVQARLIFADLQPIAMRLEQKEGINNCLLIDDTYNSDLTGLAIALDYLNQMGAHRGLSKTLILSDIFQSGFDDKELFSKMNKLILEKGVERFIGIGTSLYAWKNGVDAFKTTEDFLRSTKLSDFNNEAILLKGSRSFSFERISELLEKQRHKTVMEINLNALANNLTYYRSLLNKDTKILAMVKAFSYGSGSFEIANLLQHQKIDYLGVAFADEGIELREAGISLPIIVMNPEISSFSRMLQYELEPEIYSFEILKAFNLAVERQGLNEVPIHLKIDTGMNRLGFLENQINELISLLHTHNKLKVSSVFSHLAGSDDAQHDTFTLQQITLFEAICAKLEQAIGYSFIKHILNSAGVQRFTSWQFNMVRVGIGMYGIGVDAMQSLQQVAKLKSYVAQIKEVPQGHTVGYNRMWSSNKNITIAIVPIGYADGLDRRLSNGKGTFVINGCRVPIVGNICMDMCMVDITSLPIKEGDEVEIFGDNYTLAEMAKDMGTITYEVLTGISRRVKRIYYYE